MRTVNISFVLYIIIAFGIFHSCANQIALTGGPRDERAPQLIIAESTENYQTNFEKQDIELVFDEFIDLKEANKHIMISPPLNFPPLISSRLKKVKVAFNEEEVLRQDATYVINFGKAIKDFTEGNEANNFTFVFATGDFIDSLGISGVVIDAKTSEPKEDALVMLYTENEDSIVYKERPFYFSRTNKDGTFEINNLRADTFKVVTLLDNNLNYLYDPNDEEIGFLDTQLVLTDTIIQDINLEIFEEDLYAQYQGYSAVHQGLLKIDFDGTYNKDLIAIIDDTEHFIEYKKENDFFNLWYRPRSKKNVQFEVSRNNKRDTIQARINNRTVDTLRGSIQVSNFNFNVKTGLHPQDELIIHFDRPMSIVDTSLIFAVDTSKVDTLKFNIDQLTLPDKKVHIPYNWIPDSDLILNLLPGAITDYFGKTNDTISRAIRIATIEDFGTIELKFIQRDSFQYVIRLLQKDEVIREKTVEQNENIILFKRILPGDYSIEIIEDVVKNGKWDAGNYLEKRQSERIYQLPLEALRANWILKEELNMAEMKNAPKQISKPAVSGRRK